MVQCRLLCQRGTSMLTRCGQSLYQSGITISTSRTAFSVVPNGTSCYCPSTPQRCTSVSAGIRRKMTTSGLKGTLATMWLPLPISLMGKQSPRQRDPLAQVTQPDRPIDSMISHGSFTELNRGREKNNIRGCPPSPRQGAGCCHVFCLL